MLKRFDIKIADDFEEALLDFADSLGLSAFSSPCIVDTGEGEEDFAFTGETVVSLLVSTIEQDAARIEAELQRWLNEVVPKPPEVTGSEYADDQDWMAGFRQYFQPIRVQPGLVIRPPWAEPLPDEVEPHAVAILIDPGMAFGTGTHETTRLCLSLMIDLPLIGQTFLDVGAGSGILSFFAMKRGAAAGTALELEGAAVENMRKNAALNGIGPALTMICADLRRFVPGQPVSLLLANITTPVLAEHLPRLTGWVAPGGCGVFSGVNTTNAPKIRRVLSDTGWEIVKELTEGDWCGFLAKQPASA
jgi:ribosomal protein L11 methyltransferase